MKWNWHAYADNGHGGSDAYEGTIEAANFGEAMNYALTNRQEIPDNTEEFYLWRDDI